MSISFTQEQDDLRMAVRRFVADRSPSSEVRRLMESEEGFNPLVWRQMAEQLGLQALAIPEQFGGAGGGPVELGIVMEEMGRALFASPYFSTVVLGAQCLIASSDEGAQARWLPGIAEGSIKATLAVAEESGSWELAAVTARAEPSTTGWTVTGTKMFVPDGTIADLLLVVARTESGLGVFAVTADASGLKRRQLKTLDMTRRLARVELQETPATLLGDGTDATEMLGRLLELAVTTLAAEQVGGAQQCLDMSVEYAKVRVQFGRPIGSFQAIKHKCADVLLQVESARSAAYFAMGIVGTGDHEAPLSAALAKAYCSEAFSNAAKENIQVHGGIGFTWEHDAHLYLKRAKSSELMFGSPAFHRERLADLVGI